MRIGLGYPGEALERKLLRGDDRRLLLGELRPVIDVAGLTALRAAARELFLSDALLDYVQALVRFTRQSAQFDLGLSPARSAGSGQCGTLLGPDSRPSGRASRGREGRVPRCRRPPPAAPAGWHRCPPRPGTPRAGVRAGPLTWVPAVTRPRRRAGSPRFLQRYVQRWARRRQGPDGEFVELHQGRVYILPTRSGLVFGLVFFTMLLGALNYSNNMGFALAFLLTAVAVVSIHHCQRNLAGLRLSVSGCDPGLRGRAHGVHPARHESRPRHRAGRLRPGQRRNGRPRWTCRAAAPRP